MSITIKIVLFATIAAMVFFRTPNRIASSLIRPVQVEAEIPTRETEKTEQQKEHSKLFKQEDRKENLRDLTSKTRKDIILREHVQRIIPEPNSSSADVLREKICSADAVIVAKMGLGKSFLTEDETFVFTEHKASVEDILRDNANSTIVLNNEIVVVRPGGAVLLSNGYVVRAFGSSFWNIKADSRCILFLRYVPGTGAYMLGGYSSAIFLDGGTIVNSDSSLSRYFGDSNRSETSVVSEIRGSAAVGCLDKHK